MNHPDLQEISHLAIDAAQEAGALIKSLREQGAVNISFKSEKDLVTNADLQSEALIVKMVRDSFPDHGFLTEEGSPAISSQEQLFGPLWIIDPVDGTTNYAHGLTQVAVSIAFAFRGQVQAAAVFAPFQNELFSAVIGGGAKLNGRPISPRTSTKLSQSLVATGYPGSRRSVERLIQQTSAALTHCRDIRRFGSGALDICWVACGRIDGYWESIKPWDMAAGGLIAREARACVGSILPRDENAALPPELDGHEFLVATPGIFEELRKILDVPSKNFA